MPLLCVMCGVWVSSICAVLLCLFLSLCLYNSSMFSQIHMGTFCVSKKKIRILLGTFYSSDFTKGTWGYRGSHYFKKVPKMSPKGFGFFFYIQKMSPKGFRFHQYTVWYVCLCCVCVCVCRRSSYYLVSCLGLEASLARPPPVVVFFFHFFNCDAYTYI